jgi:pantoate--beta-alanine ligase
MKQVTTADRLRALVDAARSEGKKIGFVPTMGALHEGHLSLIRLAQQKADFVIASIFVNPLQFGKDEDFDRYPRTVEADASKLEAVGADVLFLPGVAEIYPNGSTVTKFAGPIGEILEGEARPGHFDGMLTVVARLFDLVQPDVVIFGAKDAQQLFLIRQMAAVEYPALQIVEAPIVREFSGLAMSSRNSYLSESEHQLADKINRVLAAAKNAATSPAAALEKAQAGFESMPEAKLGYISLVSAENFESVTENFRGRALLLVAAVIGKTRLIDNIEINF